MTNRPVRENGQLPTVHTDQVVSSRAPAAAFTDRNPSRAIDAMTESLRVIALISGGKDSFFSILHCLQNGHEVVALGNLYPDPPASNHVASNDYGEEHDLNSFMYQTVGHTVIPLYEQALGVPLYREPVVGVAVQTGASYGVANSCDGKPVGEEDEDETESLVPLLKKIMKAHPTANALSTGAILSTYQRTRIESVALRLGLTPLSYLWQYPILPPGTQISLLEDMDSIALDARIVKVASGGLDESFLWQNVASALVMRRVEKAMKRFGTNGDGAVLGEGGEFETLVVDGPGCLFKGRIVVEEGERRVVKEGGGVAWLKILGAKVVTKEEEESARKEIRVPDLLEPRFAKILAAMDRENDSLNSGDSAVTSSRSKLSPPASTPSAKQSSSKHLLHWTITVTQEDAAESILSQASRAISQIESRLQLAALPPTSITSSVIILRSMEDFASINTIYGSLFTAPNPPSRVTICSGSLLPPNTSLTIHLTIHNPPSARGAHPRRALHVQSRSYWAPANIGPYSQATAVPLPLSPSTPDETPTHVVHIAGQIPLVPQTMALPGQETTEDAWFKKQAVLSLQHLVRIAQEMHVSWLTSCVAYIPHTPSSELSGLARHRILEQAWRLLHAKPNGEDEEAEEGEAERDLWEEKHYAGMELYGAGAAATTVPGWEVVSVAGGETAPPFWTAEVDELPRGAGVEWAAGWGVVGGRVEVR
ncbi:hypothetical protein QTJ16_002902 [Diplocarpon rosae]|uniref:Diphthine--ammonia ligase n=1 Tax=Diplocarpon rosae TaxID=946125 RepID=A0AAD9T2X1_9HELO|nr:hypothetical protein QTJ16_002902 [Diplocarpon rosae]